MCYVKQPFVIKCQFYDQLSFLKHTTDKNYNFSKLIKTYLTLL